MGICEGGKLMITVYTELIEHWARNRGLDAADPTKQMLKLAEEFGELAQGMAKDKPDQVKDSIGDMYVVMTILSLQLGLDISECIRDAYNEIKDRKGKMINGVFVKESDLQEETK
jgi:NTP pyrophosphatase (non-canonical NTP hydrolase)